MRIGVVAVVLAGVAPAAVPAQAPRERAVAAPKVLGPMAPQYDYDSVPIAGLLPMSEAEVAGVLRIRRSFPEHSRVPTWHQRNGASRQLSFTAARKAGMGTARNAECEPAACTGTYSVSSNVVSIDFKPRQGVMRLSFYRAPSGVTMVADDWGPIDGRASPW